MSNFIREKGKPKIIQHKMANAEILEKLEPGYYKIDAERAFMTVTICFNPIESKDNLVNFETGPINDTIKKIDKFLKPETVKSYGDLKIGHKLGIILYGPPGTGKTCAATLLMEKLVADRNAICLDCTGHDPNFIIGRIKDLREIQDNPIVIFVDEIDYTLRRDEYEWLPFLDGSSSFNNVIIVGCTNNIELIPERIKDRKSRIKHLIEIKAFPIEVYREYIKDKLGDRITKDQTEQFAFMAEEVGLTIDDLKHAVIDFYIEGTPIDKAINKAKKLQKLED